jgi:hypothetical protein
MTVTTTESELAEVWESIRNRPTVTVEIASRALSVSTWAAYQAIKAGTFPVPVIAVGRRLVVPAAPLRRALGLDGQPEPAA